MARNDIDDRTFLEKYGMAVLGGILVLIAVAVALGFYFFRSLAFLARGSRIRQRRWPRDLRLGAGGRLFGIRRVRTLARGRS